MTNQNSELKQYLGKIVYFHTNIGYYIGKLRSYDNNFLTLYPFMQLLSSAEEFSIDRLTEKEIDKIRDNVDTQYRQFKKSCVDLPKTINLNKVLYIMDFDLEARLDGKRK